MRVVLAFLFLLGASGCDLSPECPGCDDPPGEPEDEIVAGVNLTQLFRAPLSHERVAVMAEWDERSNVPPPVYAVVDSLEGADGAEWEVYEAVDDASGDVVHYGLVRKPIPDFPGDASHWPVLVVAPEVGRTPADVEELPDVSSLPLNQGLENELVIGWLVYREQALRAGDEDLISESKVAPFDVDADDAVAFAQAISAMEIRATDKRGIFGHGRGGTAALLAAHRFPDEGFDVTFDIAGPSDFYIRPFKDLVRFSLEGEEEIPFPAFSWIEEAIIDPLRDGELTSADARHEFLLRSPRAFLQSADNLLVFHGTGDFVVDIRHSEVVDAVQSSPSSAFLEIDGNHTFVLEHAQVRSAVSNTIRDQLISDE